MKTENKNIKLPEASVKCRFYAQYQFSHVCFEGISNSVWNTDVCLVNGYFINNGDRGRIFMDDTPPLLLKSVSNITDADASEMQFTLINVIGLDGIIRPNSIDLIKEVIHNYDQIGLLSTLPSSCIDKLREFGYATDWDGIKLTELIDLGWIKLI